MSITIAMIAQPRLNHEQCGLNQVCLDGEEEKLLQIFATFSMPKAVVFRWGNSRFELGLGLAVGYGFISVSGERDAL